MLINDGTRNNQCSIELLEIDVHEWNDKRVARPQIHSIPIKKDSYILLMRGIPYGTQEDDCLRFFGDIPCLGVHLTKDACGRPSGQAFAEFVTIKDFNRALELNGKKMLNRYIDIFESNIYDLEACTKIGQHYGNNIQTNNNYSNQPILTPNQTYMSKTLANNSDIQRTIVLSDAKYVVTEKKSKKKKQKRKK
eukprot:UN23307